MIQKNQENRGFAVVVVLGVVALIMILIILQLYGGLWSPNTKKTALDKQLDELEAHQENIYFKKDNPVSSKDQANTHAGVQVNKTDSDVQKDTQPKSLSGSMKKEESMPLIAKKTTQPAKKTPLPNPTINGTGPGLLKDIGRARRLERSMNTKVLNENLIMWRMNNPGKKVTLENLRKTNFSMPPLKPHLEYVIENDNIRIRFKE